MHKAAESVAEPAKAAGQAFAPSDAVRTNSEPQGRIPGRFRPGDKVRCEREAPAKGTWKHWEGRVGIVRATNDGEVGVSFTTSERTEAWFLPTELVKVR